MKKFMLIAAAMVMTLAANAQKVIYEGKAPSLKGERKINIKVDFSEMKIDKKDVADWLEARQAEQPEYNAKDELEKELKPAVNEKLVEGVNDKLKKVNAYLTTNANANYTVVVKPQQVAKKGNNVNKCLILDKSGNTVIAFELTGKGGTFGSMSNLWGDGYGDAGKELGKILLNYYKK